MVGTLSVPTPLTYPSKSQGLLFHFLPKEIDCRRAAHCFSPSTHPVFLLTSLRWVQNRKFSFLMKSTGACGFTLFPTNPNSNLELLEPCKYRIAKRRGLKSIQVSYIIHGEGKRERETERQRNIAQVPSLCAAGHWPSCHTNLSEKNRRRWSIKESHSSG